MGPGTSWSTSHVTISAITGSYNEVIPVINQLSQLTGPHIVRIVADRACGCLVMMVPDGQSWFRMADLGSAQRT